MSLPPATSVLKPLIKYLQQAKQLEKVDPLMSYYCRLYALQLGMKTQNKSKDDLKFIADQMNWLEGHQGVSKGVSKDDGRARAEAFALQVFSFADDEDRAGLATKKTALNFHAAYVLFDVCRQFSSNSELASDIEEKMKYAIVKAADINKAMKEGRKPKAGPLNEPEPEENASLAPTGGAQDSEEEAMLRALMDPSLSAPTTIKSPSSLQPSPPYQPQAPAPSPSSFHSSLDAPPASSAPYSAFPSLNHEPAPLPQSFNPQAYIGGAEAAAQQAGQAAYLAAMQQHQQLQHPSIPTASPTSFFPSSSAPPPASAAPAAGSASHLPFASATPAASHTPSPSASSSPPPFARMDMFSAAAIAARNSGQPAGGVLFAKKDPKKLDATRDGERLIKHALSAIAFSDVDTTVAKLKEAVALLQPYTSK